MKKLVRPIAKVLARILALYLVFALLANILPFARGVSVSEASRQMLDQVELYGESGEGVDRAALLETPAQALGARLRVLQAARQSIDIAYHIIQTGESTDGVLGEILDAAERGVRVRILLDGTAGLVDSAADRLLGAMAAHPNISYKTYNPVNPLRPWEWQAVLHDKFIVVDDQWLILGGRNLGDRFYQPQSHEGKLTNDRDVLVWRTGGLGPEDESVLHQAAEYMDSLWDSAYVKDRRAKEADDLLSSLRGRAGRFEADNPVFYQLALEDYRDITVATSRITLIANPIHTGKKEPWIAYQMGKLALDAEQSVLVQTPYATANAGLLETLEAAAGSADSVVMVTNSMASSPNYPAFSNYYSRRSRFTATGAQIYEYQSTDSIHGKSMVVDGRISAVGSLNLDDRSIYIDTESMLVIDSAPFSQILEQAIGDIRGQSLLVDEHGKGYAPDQLQDPLEVGMGKRIGMTVVSWFSRPLQFLM